jgi:two-component system sensor histidine kinase UhpB
VALGISELVHDASISRSAPAAAASTQDLQRHFARELHDEVAQPLIALVLQIRALRAAPGGEATMDSALLSLEESVRQVLRRAREMMVDLRNRGDLRLHFVQTLNAELEVPKGRDLKVKASSRWPREINGWVAFNLLRIVQQAVTNAWRHGRAKSIDVLLDVGVANDALVVVIDDGVGIDDAPRGFGMAGMEERAVLIGGKFSAQPRETGGTRVEVRVPIDHLK